MQDPVVRRFEFRVLRERVAQLRRETLALFLAARHPRTPLAAKLLVAAVVAYALSPIDLIPDFIPVLGLLDDLVLLPAGLLLAIRLVPDDVLAACRAEAASRFADGRPVSRTAAAVIVTVWCTLAGAALWWIMA